MANAILNFHFDFLHPSLSGTWWYRDSIWRYWLVLQAVVNAGAVIPCCPISWSCCGVLTTMSASGWRAWSLVQKFYKSVFSGTPCTKTSLVLTIFFLLLKIWNSISMQITVSLSMTFMKIAPYRVSLYKPQNKHNIDWINSNYFPLDPCCTKCMTPHHL